MNNFIILLFSLCVFFVPVVATAHSSGSSGFETHFDLPSGGKLKLRMIGDNNYARTETFEGYTVIYDNNKQTYYYAKLNAKKDGFISTGFLAHKKPPVGLETHLEITPEARRARAVKKNTLLSLERQKRWEKRVVLAKKIRKLKRKKELEQQRQKLNKGGEPAPDAAPDVAPTGSESSELQAAPVLGNKVGLTILVQFPDDPNTPEDDPVNFPVSQNDIERFCNETGYSDNGNSGSVKDYFLAQSNGAMTYTMSVTETVTLPNPRNFYNYDDYPLNTSLRDSGNAGNRLITDAIAILKDQDFDFNGLTLEGNNVRSTNILFAGSTSGVWSHGLWPHAWGMYSLPKPMVTVDGVERAIHEYQITNLSSTQTRIGTFCHESGHLILDLPDLYDTNQGSSGLGQHCLMSSGNFSHGGKTPSPINIYLKEIIGWANITDLTPLEYQDVNLPALGNVGYRIVNPDNSDESFYIENRGYVGGTEGSDIWARYAPDRGIMIWHVDEGVHHNRDEQMTAANHYRVSLEQQDGEFDLENNFSGDNSDLFDNTSSEFNDANTPNANWWNGTASGIKVKVNSAPGVSMNVVFGTANIIQVISPNGGENLISDASHEIRWYGSISGNVKIDLYKGGVLLETLSADEVNDGSYVWNLNNGYVLDDDYSFRITSVDDDTILDDSDAQFSIVNESFVSGGVVPAGWIQSAGSDASWSAATDHSSEGLHSLKSDTIAHNQKADIEKSVFTEAGVIAFDAKVSSEANYDFLRFYIDGVEQDLNTADALENGMSGDSGWESKSIPITAGYHTFKWRYEKDSSADGNDDAAWIDNVRYPENTNGQLFVTSPNGGERINQSEVYTIRWTSNVIGNLKIDLFKGGSFLQTLSASEANDGEYTWSLNNAFAGGDDYSVKITSLANNTLVDTSDADFSIIEEVFVKNGIAPSGWQMSAGSNASWEVTNTDASEGLYSLKNEDINHGETAEIETTVTTDAGEVSFDIKVSSEAGYDFVRFFIDGVEQDLDDNRAGVNGISGDSGWLSKSYLVSAGEHTFKWSYEKDANVSLNDDSAWIDHVIIPEVALTGIELWKSEHFVGNDPEVIGDLADPDRDGVSNLMEYALGLDPNVMDANTGIRVEKEGNVLSLFYTKNKNATDVNFIVERSSDLVINSWKPTGITERVMSTSGNKDNMKASVTLPASDNNHFMRLKVELVE